MALWGCGQNTLETDLDGQAEKTVTYIRETVASPVIGLSVANGRYSELPKAESKPTKAILIHTTIT